MKTFKAKKRMWLTQNEDVNDEQRFFTTEIYAPDNVSDDAYRDATNVEKEAWEQRMAKTQEEFDDSLLNGDNDEQQEEQEY